MIDSGAKLPENRIHLFDPVGLLNDNYGNYGGSGSYTSVRARKATTTRSYDSFASSASSNNSGGSGGLRFVIDHNSDASLPYLWKPTTTTSQPTSPKNASPTPPTTATSITKPAIQHRHNHLHNHHHSHRQHHLCQSNQNNDSSYQTMSPTSRTQAIARGRRELMEMTKDMPESFYELSLRDIVEQKQSPSSLPPLSDHHQAHGVHVPAKLNDHDDDESKFATKEVVMVIENSKDKHDLIMSQQQKQKQKQKGGGACKKAKKSERKKKMVNAKSSNNRRFLLKTSVFPISLWSKKKRSLTSHASFKVAPKPQVPLGSSSAPGKRFSEKDLWLKRSCILSESKSSGLSSSNSQSSRSSGSSSRTSSVRGSHRRSHRFLPSCWSFFNVKRIKAKKREGGKGTKC